MPAAGRPRSVERKNARAPRARARSSSSTRDVEVGVVDDRDRVQAVGLGCQRLAEEVVAPAHAGGAVGPEELELLPVAAGVHQAVVDPDAVHPFDSFRGRRIVQRVEDDRAAALLGHAHQVGQQLHGRRTIGLGQRAQQVAGDPEREHVETAGQLVTPGCERELVARVARGLPVRVDVDDHRWTPGHGCCARNSSTSAITTSSVSSSIAWLSGSSTPRSITASASGSPPGGTRTSTPPSIG